MLKGGHGQNSHLAQHPRFKAFRCRVDVCIWVFSLSFHINWSVRQEGRHSNPFSQRNIIYHEVTHKMVMISIRVLFIRTLGRPGPSTDLIASASHKQNKLEYCKLGHKNSTLT